MGMRKGQSTFDYLVLTGVILVVIVPLLFFSTERIDRNRLSLLQDALEALKEGVTQVNNLGFGTSTLVVVRVPKGVTEQGVGLRESGGGSRVCQKGMLCYKVAGSDMTVQVPADVDGVLPTNEGLHHIQLFNNGTAVLLYECGNNKREAFEQCDGSDSNSCNYKSGNAIVIGVCTPPTFSQGACRCSCSDPDQQKANAQCAGTTGLCDLGARICVPCSLDSQCGPDKTCLQGRCSDRRPCRSNNDCSYGATVCNLRSGFCEPCDPSSPPPPYKQCNRGDECIDALPPYCKTPTPKCTSNRDCPGQVCLPSGQCGPCNSVKCDPGQICVNEKCVVQPRIPCGVGQPPCPGGQQCNVNGFCQQPQKPVCDQSNCPLPNQCRNDVCTPQTCSGQFCPGNYVCQGGICKRCSPTVTCPGAYTCNTNIGMCAPNDPAKQRGPQCGNNQLEPGEMCERTSDCPALQGFTARCSDCTCFYDRVDRRRPELCPNGVIDPGEECEKASDCRPPPGSVALCNSRCMCEYIKEGEIEW